MSAKVYIMGCTVDGLAFQTAQEGLQHYNGKKHRLRMTRFLKNLTNEKNAIHIKDASHVPVISILNYFATLGSIQTVHVEHGIGLNDTFFHSVIIFYDNEETATKIRENRHAVDCIPIGVSRYYVYDDPNRPKTPPPPTSILALDQDFVDKELRKLYTEKADLDVQMETLANMIQLRPHELTIRKDVCSQLQNTFRFSLNPHCEVGYFGSSSNGLGFQGCDLDAFLYIKQGYPEKQEEETLEKWRERCREKEKSVVLNAGKLLRDSNQENFANVNIVLEARVPTIKFVHKKTGIKCDLSFKNRMSVLNTEFIQLCCSYDQRIKPLCMVIKYWTYRYKMSGSCPAGEGRDVVLSNYALIIMIFFFLQKEEILPSVKELQDEMSSEESLKLDNWQCGYSKSILTMPKPVKANRRSISRLIFKFFDFFTTFDYKTLVISPFLGRAVTKEVFEIPRKCRQTLPSYALNVEAGKNTGLSTDSPLVVQDPFELNNNLTKEFSKDGLHVWKRMCATAKEEYHDKKIYRLFNLKDMPKRLKERLSNTNVKSEPEIDQSNSNSCDTFSMLSNDAMFAQSEMVAKSSNLSSGVKHPLIAAMEVEDPDAIDCDDSDRIFIATFILDECHKTYQDLLQKDPHRRFKDKFVSLVEVIIDHLLTVVLRFEYVDEGMLPPPNPEEVDAKNIENDEPDKKRAKKSRWDPVEDTTHHIDRKRLSELEYTSFFPFWDFRKLTRKNFNLYDKTLENETMVTDRIMENYFTNCPKFYPLTTFKTWAHHSKTYQGAVCVHLMELESRQRVWPVAGRFLREFIPQWTKYALFHAAVPIDYL